MLKSVQLKISKIRYKGRSVGRNIRIETEILGDFSRIDKRIKPGTIVKINQEIGKFKTDQKSFRTRISVTITEKDLLFNDVGSVSKNVKINSAVTKPQQFTLKIPVRETRSIFGIFWGTRTAVFDVVLEAKVLDVIGYIPDEGDGWLKVELKNSGKEKSLPAHLKVKVERVDTKREYFTILEGPYRGQQASVKRRENGLTWFIFNIRHEPAARTKYSISQKTFILKNRKYQATEDSKNPWKKGSYDIEMPDHPHGGGEEYLGKARLAKVWFRVGHSGSRYLHPGTISRGCLTVIEVEKWDELCVTLLKARKGDFMSVGVLEVVD